MKIIAIIPARGGSKGVPGKNLKLLGGRELVLHAADCGRMSKYQMDIVVTTDSDAIQDVCERDGLTVIRRPDALATDESPVIAAIQHVLDNSDDKYDLIVLLQPTAPFRTAEQLDKIIKQFEQDPALDGIISVVPVGDSHPSRMYSLSEDSAMHPFLADADETARRQDLKSLFLRNGCFYVVKTNVFREQKSMMPHNKKAYVMDPKWHVNIDTPMDFMLAELVYKLWTEQNN